MRSTPTYHGCAGPENSFQVERLKCHRENFSVVKRRLRSSARTLHRLPHAGSAKIKLDQTAPSNIEKSRRASVALSARFLARYRYTPQTPSSWQEWNPNASYRRTS